MKLITRCSVGKYTRKKGLKNVVELETELQNLLQVRLNHIFSPDDTICLHQGSANLFAGSANKSARPEETRCPRKCCFIQKYNTINALTMKYKQKEN